MNPLLLAHRHTTNNRAELEASRLCGCCSCVAVFPIEEVSAWTGLDMDNFANPDAASADHAALRLPHVGVVVTRAVVEAFVADLFEFVLHQAHHAPRAVVMDRRRLPR